MKKNKANDALQQLKAAYFQRLPAQIDALEQTWRHISQNITKEQLETFHREVHTLSGTVGTYGYLDLHHALRDLEIYLSQLIDYRTINATHISEISHLVAQIKTRVSQPAEALRDHSLASFHDVLSSRLICYINQQSSDFEQAFKKELRQFDFDYLSIKSIEEFQDVTEKKLPFAIMIDESFLQHPGMTHVTEFKTRYKLPLFCVLEHHDLDTQLMSIRVGANAHFDEDMDIHSMTRRLIEFCESMSNEECRVLILDDSVSLGEYYLLILDEAGMNARHITDPNVLINQIQEFHPNILLIDLYLPGCTGFELATLIRQDEQYMSLPIIFISTEDDRYKQLAILNACGGDDFLTKPVLPESLVAAIKSRAQRAALLNAHLVHDPLTKLFNHTYILDQLNIELHRAERENIMVTIAMLDLDYFKKINDQYGHPVGDMVLKNIANTLISHVRKNDFVGRYGGEEFIIVFPNTSIDDAASVCEFLRGQIAKHVFKDNHDVFQITVSIGLADYPRYQDTKTLKEAADQQLYQAKSRGRNQVVY